MHITMLPSSAMLESGNVRSISYSINCRKPYALQGHTLVEHNAAIGDFQWDPQRIDASLELVGLPLVPRDCFPSGYDFLHELDARRFVPLRVRAFVLKYQHLIPCAWNDYEICFPGTVYVNRAGQYVIGVIFLDKKMFKWHALMRVLDYRWESTTKALLFRTG